MLHESRSRAVLHSEAATVFCSLYICLKHGPATNMHISDDPRARRPGVGSIVSVRVGTIRVDVAMTAEERLASLATSRLARWGAIRQFDKTSFIVEGSEDDEHRPSSTTRTYMNHPPVTGIVDTHKMAVILGWCVCCVISE